MVECKVIVSVEYVGKCCHVMFFLTYIMLLLCKLCNGTQCFIITVGFSNKSFMTNKSHVFLCL